MHARATTPQAKHPFFDRALIPASEDGVEERLLTGQNAFGQGDHWFLVLDGLTVARRQYTIRRDFDRWNEWETPAVTLRFCLQGDVEAWLRDGLLHTRTGEHNVLYTPERRYRHVLRSGSRNDIVEVYLTQEYVAALPVAVEVQRKLAQTSRTEIERKGFLLE